MNIYIGIDPGTKTGVVVWSRTDKQLLIISTLGIIEAMVTVLNVVFAHGGTQNVTLIFEDSRLRTWFGSADERQKRSGPGIREGVGSVKRDCAIWQEFCEYHKIKYEAVKPTRNATKWTVEYFAKITGWTARTSQHARDAAALVYGR